MSKPTAPGDLSLVLALLLAAAPAGAQPIDGAIQGVVRDSQGAAIVGASVEIGCGADARRLTTSPTGRFAASGLPAARCRVTARSASFEPESILVDSSRLDASATLILRVRSFAAEVVVTPTRGTEQAPFAVPETVSVTSRSDIDSRPHALLPQVLREEPGVLLQQTTSAQTSPIVRGFTGQSNVFLVDGVRLNTGAWRPGPSQYTALVNGGPVDSIEVVRGAGSVQYGSDALGGTIQVRSTPAFGSTPASVNGSLEAVAASADQSVGGQVELGLRFPSAIVRIGGSRRHVNDLRAGDGLDSHSAITRFLGLPSTLAGSRQPATSFDQGGLYAVAQGSVGRGGVLRALYMHESQTGVSRYDRVLGGQGLFRSGFEPQTLDFGILRYSRAAAAGVFDGISAAFSVNRQADGRFEQSRPTSTLDRQESVTTALGYQIQVNRDFGPRHRLIAGGELYDETIDAGRELVAPNGTISTARPDIPDGTAYSSAGVFVQHTVDVVADRLSVRGGVRFSRFAFATTPDAALGVIEEDETMRAATFQGAAVVSLTPDVNVTASVTRGFRAPNASDLGGIGLTGGGGFEITTAAARSLNATIGSHTGTSAVSTGVLVSDLRPEVVYQYELGLKGRRGPFSGALNGFDMELYDFIQRRALVFDTNIVGTTIAGFEVVSQNAAGLAFVAQDVRPIATSVNLDRGRIRGVDAEGDVRISRAWSAHGYFSMANGRTLPDREFIRRMPPPMGGARLRWTGDRTWVEGVVTFATEQTRLNSGDLSDARIGAVRTQSSIASFFNGTATDMGLVSGGVLQATGETLAEVQARVLGTAGSGQLFTSQPGFTVFGLRAGVRITRSFDVTAIGENLADTNHRLYGSGVDAPGFNVQVRTRYRF